MHTNLRHNNTLLLPLQRGMAAVPRIGGIDIRQLALRPALDWAMFGAGGLMGIRTAGSMMLGMLLYFAVLAPWMINAGEIVPRSGSLAEGTAQFGRAHSLNSWSLGWGIAIMVVASMVSLFAKPQVFVDAFRTVFRRRAKAGPAAARSEDVLRDIELPLWVSYAGIPVIGALGVWMAWHWFGVHPLFGALAIPMVIALTLIAARSTAMTSITPTSFLAFKTTVDYDPREAVLKLFPIVLGDNYVWNFILIMPSWFAGAGDQTVTVTVKTGGEEVENDFSLKELAFPLEQE